MSEFTGQQPPIPGDSQRPVAPEGAYPANGATSQGYVYDPRGTQDERAAGSTPEQPTQQVPYATQPTQQVPRQAAQANPGQTAQQPVMGRPAPQANVGAGAPVPPQPPVTPRGGANPAPKQGGIKNFLMGLAGGVVGAAILTAILAATGVVGGSAAGTPAAASSGASGSSVTINASDDASVAEAVASKCLPSSVSIMTTTSEGYGLGSGVVLDTDGNIITNQHVVEGAQAIEVTIGEKTYTAELVGEDASSDIAVIKADLQGDTVTPIEIGDSDALVVGDWVMTIGNPHGLEQSASAGIVSALYRSTTMTSTTGRRIYANLIQVDANINQGNSGGMLVNDKGQLVGINTILVSSSGEFSGIGFSISGNYAVSIANKIISGETVTHAYIGLSMLTVNEQNSANLSVHQGAYVADVDSDGPAGSAGIQTGDIVTAIDDKTITSADDVILTVRSYNEGDVVKVTVNRDGKDMTFDVTLGNDEELQVQQQLQQQQYLEQQQQQQQQYQYYDPFSMLGL